MEGTLRTGPGLAALRAAAAAAHLSPDGQLPVATALAEVAGVLEEFAGRGKAFRPSA